LTLANALIQVFTAIAEEGAKRLPITGSGTLAAQVQIFGFGAGAAEDILDIHDLLIDYGTSSVITDFLLFADSGSDTLMSIDRDGTGTAHTWAQVARLEGVTALDESTLMTQGNLVA
jgi:hypothetical protein